MASHGQYVYFSSEDTGTLLGKNPFFWFFFWGGGGGEGLVFKP